MKASCSRSVAIALALLAVSIIPTITHADIGGFGDFSNFTINKGDAGFILAPTLGSIQLTNDGGLESRSIFFNTPQNITQFTASFIYQNAGITYPNAGVNGIYGATFCLQNSAAGAAAVNGNSVNAFGYGNEPFSPGIGTSAAITLEMQPAPTLSGFYTNGNLTNASLATSPVNAVSGDPISVTLAYNGSVLYETLIDTTTLQSYSASFSVDLSSVLGGSTAFVGITASTGNSNVGAGNDGFQSFSNFQFTSGVVPEPASSSVLLVAISAMANRRRRGSLLQPKAGS